MFRYLALIWNPHDSVDSHAIVVLSQLIDKSAIRWRTTVSEQGLRVFCFNTLPTEASANDAYTLTDGGGVVLGALFRKNSEGSSGACAPTLGKAESARIVTSRGQRLFEKYWGRYVAFLYDRRDGARVVLRDPTGAMPCFVTARNNVTVVFSFVEDCLALGLGPFTINWEFLAARVCVVWRLETRETGLREIHNVSAGESYQFIGSALRREFLWHPFQVVRSGHMEDVSAAADSLFRNIRDCVAAWASRYRGILLMLSGGLDSSIVLTALDIVAKQKAVTGLNYHSAGVASDERSFASCMAQRVGVALLTHLRDPTVSLRGLLSAQRTPSPILSLQWLEHGRIEAETARTVNATAVFGGQFGDQLFYQHRLDLCPADYVHRNGLTANALTLTIDAAYSAHVSVWKILKQSLLWGCLRTPLNFREEALRYRVLVADELRQTAVTDRRFIHPWFHSKLSIPPGKRWQIQSMADSIEFYDPFQEWWYPEYVYPLLSQPIIELCLMIPTYVLCEGGRDRALARRAFSSALPVEVLERRSKGEMQQHYRELITKDLDFLRELLLDGSLVKERLLDRARLESVLSGRISNVRGELFELIDYASIEAWVDSWPH